MLNLDHNATTVLHPKVKKFIFELLDSGVYNPSSIHSNGRFARMILENARLQVAKSVGVDLKEYDLIFTSSGTESNNLLLANYLDADVFISSIEHISIFAHLNYSKNLKCIKVDNDGIIDLHNLESLLASSSNKKKLVSIMFANNETGVIQNIYELKSIIKKYGAHFHSDCVQVLGKIEFNISELGIDIITISAHKIGGIHGSSALIARSGYISKSMIIGGGQESNLRSGTENVLSIGSFGLAAELAKEEINFRYNKMKELQVYLENELIQYQGLRIVSKKVTRLPNTTLIILNDADAQTKLIALDLQKIAVGFASTCSSGKIAKSHVLKSMGYSDLDCNSALRISFSYNESLNDIDYFLQVFKKLYFSKIET